MALDVGQAKRVWDFLLDCETPAGVTRVTRNRLRSLGLFDLQAGRLPGTLGVMIPHAEFERVINQWKIRQQGGQVVSPAGDVASGAVVGEMPLANAEPGFSSGETPSDDPGPGSLSGEFATKR